MKNVLLPFFCLILFVIFGCQSNQDSDSVSLFSNDLVGDAYKTYVSYGMAVKTGLENYSDEIPPAYWADRIKALNPVRVYTHRVNIVVVQHISEGMEDGKYICIPISSYLPRMGDDGFLYIPNPRANDLHSHGKDVYEFKRSSK